MNNILYFYFLIIMTFGNRKVKVKKEKVKSSVSEDSKTVDEIGEKVSIESNSTDSSSSSVDSSDNVSVSNVKASSFLKRKSKSKKSDVLLFGISKEEKLELFIKNIKIIHSKIPDFWLEKEIEKFKKKFNIE